MSAENKTVVGQLVDELCNRGDYGQAQEILHERFRGHDPVVGDWLSSTELVDQIRMLRQAFPDLRLSIETQLAAGDSVATHWLATGTHRAPFLGMPATRRAITVSGMAMSHIEDGRIVELWIERDTIAVMKGLAPQNFLDVMSRLLLEDPGDQPST